MKSVWIVILAMVMVVSLTVGCVPRKSSDGGGTGGTTTVVDYRDLGVSFTDYFAAFNEQIKKIKEENEGRPVEYIRDFELKDFFVTTEATFKIYTLSNETASLVLKVDKEGNVFEVSTYGTPKVFDTGVGHMSVTTAFQLAALGALHGYDEGEALLEKMLENTRMEVVEDYNNMTHQLRKNEGQSFLSLTIVPQK